LISPEALEVSIKVVNGWWDMVWKLFHIEFTVCPSVRLPKPVARNIRPPDASSIGNDLVINLNRMVIHYIVITTI
jgi:hypothetical protein